MKRLLALSPAASSSPGRDDSGQTVRVLVQQQIRFRLC